jgi:transcriptional regulator with XRE-family HTH domain
MKKNSLTTRAAVDPADQAPKASRLSIMISDRERAMMGIRRRQMPDAAGGAKTVCARMRQARTDAEISREVAASAMGLESSRYLAQIEAGTQSIPLPVLCEAAKLYGVTADYLLGLIDEPDPDPGKDALRATTRRVTTAVTSMTESVVGAIQESLYRDVPAAEALGGLLIAVESLLSAFGRFRELNADVFDDMPAGASVSHAALVADEQMGVAVRATAGYRSLGTPAMIMEVKRKMAARESAKSGGRNEANEGY